MSTPRLTPAMMTAGVKAARTILDAYSKYASGSVSDDELYTIVQTVGIAMLTAQEQNNDQSS